MTGPMMIANSLSLSFFLSLFPFISLSLSHSLSRNHSLFTIIFYFFFLLLPFSFHHSSKLFALTDMLEIFSQIFTNIFISLSDNVRPRFSFLSFLFFSFLFFSFFFQSLLFFHFFFFFSLLVSLSVRSICKLRLLASVYD